jgi:hypothetical protein
MNHSEPIFPVEPTVPLTDAAATVLGSGSVGGVAAWCLASAGVGCLHIADRDYLTPNNLRRHVYGTDELERPKARAVARFLRSRFPEITFRAHDFCFLGEPWRLRRLIRQSEAVLVAVDDEGPKYLVNDMAWEVRRAVVYVGVYGGGWGAEVILTDPSRDTPCYGCAASSLGRGGIDLWPHESQPAYAPSVPPRGDSPWPQADLRSIGPAAALAAQVVTARLAAARGREAVLSEFVQSGFTAWRVVFRHVKPWDLGPWALEPVAVARQGNCPVCGSHGSAGALTRIQELLKEHLP